jgi:hypothetical protein
LDQVCQVDGGVDNAVTLDTDIEIPGRPYHRSAVYDLIEVMYTFRYT